MLNIIDCCWVFAKLIGNVLIVRRWVILRALPDIATALALSLLESRGACVHRASFAVLCFHVVEFVVAANFELLDRVSSSCLWCTSHVLYDGVLRLSRPEEVSISHRRSKVTPVVNHVLGAVLGWRNHCLNDIDSEVKLRVRPVFIFDQLIEVNVIQVVF